MGTKKALKKRPYVLLPGEHADIRKDVATIIPDADRWLESPNPHFGLEKPGDLIGTDREWLLRSFLRRLAYGIPT